jgi:DNA-binding GntR family transcriptional regulator
MDDVLNPLDRNRPLWERTYDALERLIIHRQLPPGSRLVESELAAQLGVSRNPVREAIRALESAGWVDVVARKGAHVVTPAPEEGDHLFEVRWMFEPQAAALAAERVDGAQLAHLDEVLADGFRAAERGDADATVELNAVFHRAVFAAAGNDVLVQTLRRLEKRAMWHFSTIATARGLDSWHEHTSLLDALRRGDGARASQEMADHVMASWRKYGERGEGTGSSQPEGMTGGRVAVGGEHA